MILGGIGSFITPFHPGARSLPASLTLYTAARGFAVVVVVVVGVVGGGVVVVVVVVVVVGSSVVVVGSGAAVMGNVSENAKLLASF